MNDIQLRDFPKTYNHKVICTGWSGAKTYYFTEFSAYLKIAPFKSIADLAREKRVLEWLEGKFTVPKVLRFEQTEDKQYIFITEIAGRPASELVAANSDNMDAISRYVESTGRSMRAIHDLAIEDCPFVQSLNIKLGTALKNIRSGFVDESDFENENLGRSSTDIYVELLEKKPEKEDLVFTHGDFCLPNQIVVEEGTHGFIDFDRAGIADRYQDIALFLRSFEFNSVVFMNVEAIFSNAYRLDVIDREKLYYYRLLDELF